MFGLFKSQTLYHPHYQNEFEDDEEAYYYGYDQPHPMRRRKETKFEIMTKNIFYLLASLLLILIISQLL